MLSRSSARAVANTSRLALQAQASSSARASASTSRKKKSTTTLGPSRRSLTCSAAASLPRQLPRKSVQGIQDQDQDEEPDTFPAYSSSSAPQPSNISDELSGTDPSIPWFLQTETVEAPIESALEVQEGSTHLDLQDPKRFSYIPDTPKVEIPKAILKLQSHLITGPSSNLVARPIQDEPDQLTPVTLIHPASLSKDPSSDAFGDNDWIVVVQVRSGAAGSVRRVALDIGKFLKQTRPPAMELEQGELSVDDILGPGPSAPRYQKASSPPSADNASAPQRPKGMSRIEFELGKSLPDWAVNRIALKRKFPEGWRPPKTLSREAQEGIRLLNATDPEQFDVVELSQRFRVSKESIRRILKSGNWNVSGETRNRQDRRAAERASARETSELEEIRKLQSEDADFVEEGESPEIEGAADEFLAEEDDGTPGLVPVRYEGLVMSTADAAATGVNAKSKTSGGNRKGDGNWCLIDAEWCMVHVMTEQARFNYDIEGMWRELEVGKQVPARPWEDQEDYGSSNVPPSYRPRTKRSIFGESVSKKQRQINDMEARFGDKRRFTTSSLRRSSGQIPETMNQTLNRARIAFEGGSKDPFPVTIKAWLRSTRKQKSITFLEVSDGTLQGTRALQAVVRSPKEVTSSEIDRLAGLTVGTALQLVGHIKPGRGTKKGQEVELDVSEVQVISGCDLTFPLAAVQMQQNSGAVEEDGYSASIAERRNPHLLGRLPRYVAVMRTRERLERGMGAFLSDHEFVKVACPILTSSDCEGAGEVFQVGSDSDVEAGQPLASFWSGSPTYLTVSSQLHLEAIGLGLNRVWTLNPAFRAEGSATNRHLAEFWMLEVEMYFTDLDGILKVAEGMIKAGLQTALAAQQDMEILGGASHLSSLRSVVESSWKRITYEEAFEILAQAPQGTFLHAPDPKKGLASEHEKYLASQLGPVFVTHYPRAQKAFYMKRANDQEGKGKGEDRVECFDLLIPDVGELVGGSVREHRPDQLAKTLQEFSLDGQDNNINININSNQEEEGGDKDADDKGTSKTSKKSMQEKLSWYIQDLKKFGGAVPHAGFGLGIERLTAWITNTESVKDVVPFPRTKGPVRF